MIREVLLAEPSELDRKKMTPSQMSTGAYDQSIPRRLFSFVIRYDCKRGFY